MLSAVPYVAGYALCRRLCPIPPVAPYTAGYALCHRLLPVHAGTRQPVMIPLCIVLGFYTISFHCPARGQPLVCSLPEAGFTPLAGSLPACFGWAKTVKPGVFLYIPYIILLFVHKSCIFVAFLPLFCNLFVLPSIHDIWAAGQQNRHRGNDPRQKGSRFLFG